MSYVVELDAFRLPDGPVETLRFSSGRGFTTRPDDVPANGYIIPRLTQPLIARRDLFERATTYGPVGGGAGEIRLANPDGFLDGLLTGYAINGRAVLVWVGLETRPFPSRWTLAMTGRAELARANGNEVVISLKDALAALDKPLLPGKYLGDNALPDGFEGVEQDLKDRRKPRVYGSVLNISPPLVNTSRLVYQVSDRSASVSAVYDRGVALTAGAAYATLSEVQSAAPAAGHFRVYAGAEGTYVRLGSSPAGTVTCDAATGETRAATLAARVASDMDMMFSAGDVAWLDAENPAPVGVWATDDVTAADVITQLLGSVGAWWGTDRFGDLRWARLTTPAVTGTDIEPAAIMSLSLLSTADADNGVPARAVKLAWGRNFTVQDDLAGSVPADRKAWLADETRTARAENGNADIWPDAPEIEIDTVLLDQSAAAAEAARLLSLYGQQRQLFEVRIRAASVTAAAYDLGSTVTLTWPRYGLDAGKRLVVIGWQADFGLKEITLRLWG